MGRSEQEGQELEPSKMRNLLRQATDGIPLEGPGFPELAQAAGRRRRIRTATLAAAAGAAVVAAAVAVTWPHAIGTDAAHRAFPAASGRASAPIPPSKAPSAPAATTASPTNSQAKPECLPRDISVHWSPDVHPSMPGVVYFLQFTNQTRHACTVRGYPRLRVASPKNLREDKALYVPGNAALGHIPVATVVVKPGKSAETQVMFGSGAGDGVGCATPTWRVRLPRHAGHPTIAAMPATSGAQLCEGMPYVVSPVYPAVAH